MRAELAQALRFFDVPEGDLAGVHAADDEVCRNAALAAWVAATADRLTAAVGRPSPPPPLDPRPDGNPGTVAYLPLLAFSRALPTTRAWAQARGIPDTVVAATMHDVGRMLTRNRLWFGRPGLDDELAGWLTRHLVGSILEVGRLQYERSPLGLETSRWLRDQGAALAPGDVGVKLHVPETGPLRPTTVRDSLRAGRSLLRRRFPEEPSTVRVCVSWLLDPQLAEYLPPTSNLVAFQRFFRAGPVKGDEGDLSVRKFVFGNVESPVEELPQRTTLQRAVVQHWKAGGHWRQHLGWVDEQAI